MRLLWLATIALLCFVTPLAAQTLAFVSFDAPDAGTGTSEGTFPTVINQSGVIAGYYSDGSNVNHGFVRSADGEITEFDPPNLIYTYVSGINGSGQLVGNGLHRDTHFGIYFGFLRGPGGDISALRVPGANETFPAGINDSGEITGTWTGPAGAWHAFIVIVSGGTKKYTVFDEPAAATTKGGQGTFAAGVNANGEITGYYSDANTGVFHGYIRDHNGNFTSFDAPGAGTGFNLGTIPLAINRRGEVTGYYNDSSGREHGFIRDVAGNVTDFDPPGAVQTYPSAIDDAGEVLGYWANSASLYSGFVRDASGDITSFSAPVPNTATYLYSINNAGHMAGFYADANVVNHGFVQ